MAPTQVAVPSLPSLLPIPATNTPITIIKDKPKDNIQTIDSLLRHRARTYHSGIDYVDYTLQQLNVFAYHVARHYQSWIPTRTSSAEKPITVALFGPSNFGYLVSMLALAKLGHTVLFLSTRLSQVAIESLIETTGTTYLLADLKLISLASAVQSNKSQLNVSEIAGASHFDFTIEVHADTRLDYQLDPDIVTKNNIFIIHSSSSTGLPKPMYQPHFRAIANYSMCMDMKAFITLPLYHNHGICNFFRAIYSCISIHTYNADLPLTQPLLTKIFQEHKFEIFYGVPYAPKLLAEIQEGIQLLRELKIVMYGGSACPDALGELLVENGVNLVGHYGTTEVGQLMTSFRLQGDKAWNYVRENNKLKPYLRWVLRGPNLFECTVTDGKPAKVTSNCDDGIYATKDLFELHPEIPHAWKYIARLDDTIVLVLSARHLFYSSFHEEMDAAYDQSAISSGELKALWIPELQTFILDILTTLMHELQDVSADADFYSLGVDSLQSLQMRTEILKNVDIGDNHLGQNLVFKNPSITALSQYLYGLREGQTVTHTLVEVDMCNLVERYGSFSRIKPSRYSVAVTGAMGSLGAHIVAQLATREDVSTIYAFVRAQNAKEATHRVRKPQFSVGSITLFRFPREERL